jgi:hypothetical protein
MQSGSTYLVQTDPNSDASSLIKVAGQATLAGSAVHVGVQSDAATDYQVGKTYTILEASQIVGTFDSATSNYAYLDATLGYTSHEVTLQLQRKGSSTGGGDMGFAELAETRNQSSVANAISSLSSSSALYQFVEKLPAGTLRRCWPACPVMCRPAWAAAWWAWALMPPASAASICATT